MRRPLLLAPLAALLLAAPAEATLKRILHCQGASACVIAETPPALVRPDPNDGLLLTWNERQNVFLEEDLPVDRVADPEADYVLRKNGRWHIAAGTIVSSHYVQWDPAEPVGAVRAVIEADSPILAFITDTFGLIRTDALLGHPQVDYNDFLLRGLEETDAAWFDGAGVGILWLASSPGDWARLITAYSPGAGVRGPTPPAIRASAP